MFKNAKCWLIPTKNDNPVIVPLVRMPQKDILLRHVAGGEFRKYLSLGFQPHHLYITINERPKAGDYSMDGDELHGPFEEGDIPVIRFDKIIASTDISLVIKREDLKITSPYFSSLPTPSNAFINKYIEMYNEKSSITDIKVKFEDVGSEEWMGDDQDGEPFWNEILELKVNQDNTIIIKNEWS